MGYDVHCPVRKSPLFVSILSQFNSPRLYPISYRFIWILFSHLHIGLPKWPLSFSFPYQNSICTSPVPHTCHVPLPPSHTSWFNYPSDIGRRIQFIKLHFMQFSQVFSSSLFPLTSCLLDPNILLTTVFKNTSSLFVCSLFTNYPAIRTVYTKQLTASLNKPPINK
jgi:hypothetical protein